MSLTAEKPSKPRRPATLPGWPADVPLLDTGYRLSQPEFHRRYELMPEVKRAELIEGVVFMGSPLSRTHSDATAILVTWLGCYSAATPGTTTGVGASTILDHDNEYQPDAHLLIEPRQGGQSGLHEGKYIKGAPELVVEVALSSLAHDLHAKRDVYRRNGVREYLVWSLPEARLHWFDFAAGDDARIAPDARGLLRSRVFPGLWLDAAALLAGDLKKVLAVARRGLAGADYRAFVKKLAAARPQ
jgi:Uma2 family endonuclease